MEDIIRAYLARAPKAVPVVWRTMDGVATLCVPSGMEVAFLYTLPTIGGCYLWTLDRRSTTYPDLATAVAALGERLGVELEVPGA